MVASTSGNGYFSRFYLAATKHFLIGREDIGVHLSYLYNRRREYKLNGIAGGHNLRPQFRAGAAGDSRVRFEGFCVGCHLSAFQSSARASRIAADEVFHRRADVQVLPDMTRSTGKSEGRNKKRVEQQKTRKTMKSKFLILSLMLAGAARHCFGSGGQGEIRTARAGRITSLSAWAWVCRQRLTRTRNSESPVSPLINVSVGKLINPVWGVRGQIYGWQAKQKTAYSVPDDR